jgi:CheY-like chemotaxis protein
LQSLFNAINEPFLAPVTVCIKYDIKGFILFVTGKRVMPTPTPTHNQNLEDSHQLSGSGAPLRVLVVDDNLQSAQTLGWMIESIGHEVRLATSGNMALDTATEFTPHVVMLDIGMPGMNGYELCQVMKQSPDLRKSVFVAQTGWSKEEHQDMSREAGFDHYLVKPIKLEELEKLLSLLLRNTMTN